MNNQVKLVFNSLDGFIVISISDVLYIEAARSYANLHLINGDKKTTPFPLKYCCNVLENHHVFRLGNSIAINAINVVKYEKKIWTITFTGGTKLQIPKSKSKTFQDFMKTNFPSL